MASGIDSRPTKRLKESREYDDVQRRPHGRELALSDDDESKWTGPFTFVQAADTQLGFMSDPTWGGTGDGSTWEEEIALAERLVRCVNALSPRPRFLTICGDLVHALPEGLTLPEGGGNPSVARYASEERWRRQNRDFKRVMSYLEVPLVCVCGNHDVGDRPTPASLQKYASQYGDDYFGFWCGGVRCLVLNSQLFSDSKDAEGAQAAQVEWLAGELACLQQNTATVHATKKQNVVFQHIPWFLRNEQEPREGYFNLDRSAREDWLPRLRDAGISKIFCGHYHRNAGGFTDDGQLEVVVTSAVGRQMSPAEVLINGPVKGEEGVSDTRSGMRIVEVLDDGIKHRYHEFEALECEVSAAARG